MLCGMTTLLLTLLACRSDTGTNAIPRRLESFPYVDAGAVAPLDRRSFIVPLFSTGRTKLRIFDMQIVDDATGAPSEVFQLDDAWRTEDSDGDGVGDARDLEAYDEESDDDTLALPVIFAPPTEGFYSAVMTLWSDDNETTERAPLPTDPERETGIWKVQLRAVSAYACARVIPAFLDFGARPPGGQFTETVGVENCGLVRIDIAQANFDGTLVGSVESGTLYPLYVLPGESAPIDIRYTASSTPVSGNLSFVSNAAALTGVAVAIQGNLCTGSDSPGWDQDNDGWSSCGGDCDDLDYSMSPAAFERAGNSKDDDCDGEVDEAGNPTSTDDDGDGCNEVGQGASCFGFKDCDDADPTISPSATELADDIDNNCDGDIDNDTERSDDDGDGLSEREGDCDDSTVLVNIGVAETTDSIDNDCDGQIDEGGPDYDDDGDGWTDNEGDCDDGDPWAYSGAFEFCDYYDNDCDDVVDNGEDGSENGACAFIPERKAATN